MRINWGTGIVLAFIGFISFILFFIVRMSTDDRANHDLVTEDYYKAELGYQNEIDAMNNAKFNNALLVVEKTKEGLLLKFPEKMDFKEIKGSVSLYRPSNKYLDAERPLRLTSPRLLIPDDDLVEGRWDIKVAWEYGREVFLHKQSITY
ncbi:FixH family protein [Aggregatimonas sangjinii]|uniref:FixH family protein n=1 Tax=Aggregatimonas sangjinii TaxID=2583587 RepID=A0A5B7SN01_9FLAO|nr:FixH family protein [Aggregatimonas sangjinii]QCW99511.1 FixH family protein [Aggregatimonas sangjinii]